MSNCSVRSELFISRDIRKKERRKETRKESKKNKAEEWVAQMFRHKHQKEKVTRGVGVTFSDLIAQLQLHTLI